MAIFCVGVSAAEVKVLRTFGDDKSSFTTLLRELSLLGDAPGSTTYDDSGSRRRERGVTRASAARTTAS
jgi:hypothetical protein